MTAAETFDDHKARRNAVILAIAQALYGATLTALVVTSGLVGTQLAPDPSWATMPMSMTIIGTALTTFPISLMMKRIGRRAGFMICAMLGALGSLLGTYAIFEKSFGL
ncbi:MAG: MFS transporter, partial [Aestuariivirga sp.]